MTESIVSRRRQFIALLGAAGATGFAGCSILPRDASPAIDLTTPQARMRTFVRMRGALDDQLVIGCLTGRYYGVVDGELVPFFGIAAATFSRYRLRSDGTCVFALFEQAYFTDLVTGVRLEEWKNPVTGQVVKPPITRSQPARLVIGPDLSFQAYGAAFPGVSFDHRALAPEVQMGDVVFREQAIYTASRPGAPKPFHYNEVVTMRARVADLLDPATTRVRTTVGYTSASNWRPWMEMGDRPGELVGTGAGGQSVTVPEMPRAWRDATATARPELLADPGAPLAAVWASTN